MDHWQEPSQESEQEQRQEYAKTLPPQDSPRPCPR